MADEPVVVRKSRPMKAGNSVEDKTETTIGGGSVGTQETKSFDVCEGAK